MADHPQGSAVFVGCARSCGAHLDGVLAALDALASTYENSAIVIFENDSTDDTAARLSKYAASRSDVVILSQPGLAAEIPRRTQRLAAARNACLDFIRNSDLRTYDHLIVADLDEVNAGPTDLDGFWAARRWLETHAELNALFANSQPIYYDLWALRHPTWCPTDCWAEVRDSSDPDASTRVVYSRMIPISPTAAPIKVESAFGGLGLYRMDRALQGAYADPSPEAAGQCEHVQFHAEILAKAGGEFAIFPPLTNHTSWQHVIAEFSGELMVQSLTQDGRTGRLFTSPGHPLSSYRELHPLYDRRLPQLSRLVSETAPGTRLIDVGANVGDTIALCRLAGCTLEAVAIEASLSYYKILRYNLAQNPQLFGPVTPVWAFVGRSQDQAPLNLHDGTASVLPSVGGSQVTAPEKAPVLSFDALSAGDISLMKTDTDGYDHIILRENLDFLQKAKPILWCETQTETPEADAGWRDLLSDMAPSWPWIMAFDNFGFCLLAGPTAEYASGCAALISASRRYRRAEALKANGQPRLYYLDVALFPERFTDVFQRFCAGLTELTL